MSAGSIPVLAYHSLSDALLVVGCRLNDLFHIRLFAIFDVVQTQITDKISFEDELFLFSVQAINMRDAITIDTTCTYL